jgi:hypothetical protein
MDLAMTRLCYLSLVALLALLLTAGPAQAVEEGSSNPFDWAHPWSYSRVGATTLFVVLSFLAAFGVYFRIRLAPEQDIKSAPWPLNVFGESLIVGILLGTLSFLLFFAWLEDDLRRIHFRYFPSAMVWPNKHGWELVVVLVALVLCLLCLVLFRHREAAGQKAR